MITPSLVNSHSDSYTKILYIPVDGAPLVYAWSVVQKADVVVPYLPWGKKMIERWVPESKPLEPIPHGVDTTFYAPVSLAERAAYRKQVIGVEDDDVVMISVSRNQARKNLPALVEMTYYIRSGDYMVCKECGKAYRNPYDYHLGKPTGKKAVCTDPTCWTEWPGGCGHKEPEMIPGKPNEKFFYYIHTPVNDLHGHSWKITDMLDVFGLGVEDGRDVKYPGFRWNDNVKPVHGISEEDLKGLMGSSDIFALATIGEGFGLPILEAMACGVPVVVPNTSSHPDFVGEGGGILIDTEYYVCETLSTYYRGYPNLDDYLTSILLLVNDPGLRSSLGQAARATALKYEWSIIAEQWRTLINAQISKSRPAKRWHKLTTV
jgi:glycosyltransferase involved in cell wall biosynthesis